MENIDLQEQINELNRIIEDLNNKLTDSEAFKGNFISNVMNEVYNPFSSILTLSDNILSLKDDQMPHAKKMAEFIFQEASKLDFHLQNIFTAATIEAGLEELEISHVDIKSIHDNTVEKLKINIKDKELKILSSFKIDESDTIYSDPKKIKLILANLLSNSIKHCINEGIVTCTYKIENEKLSIIIEDEGQGISDDDLKTIYNRFHKIDENINSVTGGAGLGLSVVKALVELLDGDIEISNKSGTLVKVEIPIQDSNNDEDFMDGDLFDEEIF